MPLAARSKPCRRKPSKRPLAWSWVSSGNELPLERDESDAPGELGGLEVEVGVGPGPGSTTTATDGGSKVAFADWAETAGASTDSSARLAMTGTTLTAPHSSRNRRASNRGWGRRRRR